jgi:subtilisin family serine protease
MNKRVVKIAYPALVLSALALILVLTFEACSPMKSSSESTNSDSNICSAVYDPPASLTSKPSSKKLEFVFDKQKVHLQSSVMGKAQTLLGRKIVVDINMQCTPAPGSLSEKIILQNISGKNPLPSHMSHAFEYIVEDDIDIPNLISQADSDLCIKGITPDAEVKVTGLILPSTTDQRIYNQYQLSSTNYIHAFEYMAKTFDGSTKVKVAFVDTGVDCSHSDLLANLENSCGYNAIDGGASLPTDNDGHGSHTLGIVGAVTNNNAGILGLAANMATMKAIKSINLGSGTVADTADGIQNAISTNQDIINLSIEADISLPLIEQRVQEAVAAGIVVVIAAGNSGKEISGSFIVSPANIGHTTDGAITVGSVNSDSLLLSYFSNFGSQVEIAAPGALVDSTNAYNAGLYSTFAGGNYSRMMGTSQAAPIITGAATLLIQFFKQRSISYTPATIETIIKASTDKDTRVNVAGNRVINFSKLTRNAYAVAGVDLCPQDQSK